jgi:hypothetical protein
MHLIERVNRGTLIAAISLAMIAVGAGPAGASTHKKGVTVKVKTGTLTIVFDEATLKSIDSGSPAVGTVTSAVTPATEPSAGTLVFPISHGSLNSVSGHGTIAASGGFTIESHLDVGFFESSSSATATSPSASLARTSQMTMTSTNFKPSTVAFFTLGLAHAKVSGNRHGVSVSKLPVSLTSAGVLLFGASFKAGEQIATATIVAKA